MLDPNKEAVVIHLSIEASGGCLFFLKTSFLETENVRVYWATLQNSQGQNEEVCNRGEFIVTNSRIVVFEYAEGNPSKIESVWSIPLSSCQYVSYNESVLNLQLASSYTLRLNIAFPDTSLATKLVSIDTGGSYEDRAQASDAKRRNKEFEAKATNAKNLLYQFFQIVIERQKQAQKKPPDVQLPKQTIEVLENLEKLRQAGILSDSEFLAKKREILSRL